MPNEYIELTKSEFDNLKLINNNVAIEVIIPKDYEIRSSGIVLVKDYNLFISHSHEALESKDDTAGLDRVGKVAKICDKLYFKTSNRCQGYKLDWTTKIEIQVDDIVAFDYHSAHHCPILKVEGKEYRILNYQNLIVAKRRLLDIKTKYVNGEKVEVEYYYKIIPLNGYCLFSRVKKLVNSSLILNEENDKKRGKVKYVGSKNVEYLNKKLYDDIDIKEGEEVLFRTGIEVLLEDKSHFHMFNEELKYAQRKDICTILNN